MKKINRLICLGLIGLVAGVFMASSAEAGKKKNVPCHYMYESDIPVPTFAGAGYSWYLLETCDEEWNGDFLRFQNKHLEKSLELRKEKGKPILKLKQEELTNWYQLGQDVIAVLSKGVYTIIDLKTGKVNPTDFENLAISQMLPGPGPDNYFVWRTFAPDSAQPVPAYPVKADGTIGEAFPNSDMRRMAFLSGGYCDASAFNAAIAIEERPFGVWAELRRVSMQGPADLTPAGSQQANCDKFNYHLFAGKRASDGLWQLLSGQDGVVFDPATTYASFDEAVTDINPAIARWSERVNKAAQAEADKKASEEAAITKKNVELEAAYETARAKVRELQAQGNFEAAAKHAEINLPSKEWGLAVIDWVDAPLSEIERAVSRNNGDPSLYYKGGLGPLMERLHALRACDQIKPSQSELNGDFSFTMNYGPKKRTLNEIYSDLAYAQKMQTRGINERWVYDVANNQWKLVYASPGDHVPTFTNIPTAEQDAAARNSAGQSRVQAYYDCVSKARMGR